MRAAIPCLGRCRVAVPPACADHCVCAQKDVTVIKVDIMDGGGTLAAELGIITDTDDLFEACRFPIFQIRSGEFGTRDPTLGGTLHPDHCGYRPHASYLHVAKFGQCSFAQARSRAAEVAAQLGARRLPAAKRARLLSPAVSRPDLGDLGYGAKGYGARIALLVAAVKAFMKANKLSQAQVGREVRISQAVISKWLSLKYHGHNDKVDAAMRTWLDARQPEASAAAVPSSGASLRMLSAA